MIWVLIHRLELAGADDLALDADLVCWIGAQVGFEPDLLLAHCSGLVGNLTGAERLARDLLPLAGVVLGWDRDGAAVALVRESATGATHAGSAAHMANALLAATLRCYAGSAPACAGAAVAQPMSVAA